MSRVRKEFLFLFISSVSSFLQNAQVTTKSHMHHKFDSRPAQVTVSNDGTPKDQKPSGEKDTATLTLAGKVDFSSNPLPKTTKEKLSLFLDDSEIRNLLITAGGALPLTDIELTPQLLETWEKICDKVDDTTYPDENDSVVKVNTSSINFPGFQIESLATIGVKKTFPSQDNTIWEFVLLGDEQKVKGLAPVIWIFNKLTGAGEKNNKDRQSVVSISKISYKELNDSQIVFTSCGHLIIKVNFPKALLRILPTNKEKAEKSGGKSVANLLKKDVAASIKAFEKAYVKTLS